MPDQYEEIRRRIAELKRCELAIAYEARIGGDWTAILDKLSSQIASLERAMGQGDREDDMNKIRSKLVDRISAAWCDWTHGGGYLWRDYLGRIYWRCAKCGRLSDDPVRETKAKKGLNRYSAKTLIDIAMARRDPEAARALYMLTSDKEPMFVEEYHQVCFKAQQIVDDLFDVMEWLRRDSLFAQADRVRTLLARLARSVPPHPCFGAWDSPGEVRDLARTFAEQLTVKESKAIIARAEAAEQKLAALEASQVKVPPSL